MVEWATPRQLGHLHEFAHHALAQAALGAGDFEECYANATAISPPGTLGSHTTQALWVALDVIDAAVHTGRNREARAHADAMRRADLGRLSPRFALVTAAATAMVAPDDEAPDLFVQALALPAIEEWPFELARVRLAHGERLRRLRRIRDARSQLEAARDGFERLGARPWSRRAATELGCHRRDPSASDGRRGSVTHAPRARDRPPRRDRPDEPPDRHPAVRVAAHGLGPPLPDLPQARHHLAGGPARRLERIIGRHCRLTVAAARDKPRSPQSSD